MKIASMKLISLPLTIPLLFFFINITQVTPLSLPGPTNQGYLETLSSFHLDFTSVLHKGGKPRGDEPLVKISSREYLDSLSSQHHPPLDWSNFVESLNEKGALKNEEKKANIPDQDDAQSQDWFTQPPYDWFTHINKLDLDVGSQNGNEMNDAVRSQTEEETTGCDKSNDENSDIQIQHLDSYGVQYLKSFNDISNFNNNGRDLTENKLEIRIEELEREVQRLECENKLLKRVSRDFLNRFVEMTASIEEMDNLRNRVEKIASGMDQSIG